MVEPNSGEKYTALFIQLLLSFQAAAWQQLGKVKNPFTDKIERNLEQARHTIDMLEMLRAKSQGNLSDDEKSFLDRTISELQLNFVAEAEKGDQPEEKPAEAPAKEKEEPKEKKEPEKKTTGKKSGVGKKSTGKGKSQKKESPSKGSKK